MSRDLLIIPETSGNVDFAVTGALADCGLLLLQRLYVILFSSSDTAYRENTDGLALFDLIKGGNMPPAGVLNARIAIAKSTALATLDSDDRDLIDTFTAVADDEGNIQLTLTLKDGTTIKGEIYNG